MNLTAACEASLARVNLAVEIATAAALDTITRDFARCRVQHGIPPFAIGASRMLRLPQRFQCPECGGRLVVEIDEWSDKDRIPTAGGYRVLCEPDTDAELAAWDRDEDHEDGHRYFQSDWEHIQRRVGKWMVRNVRVV